MLSVCSWLRRDGESHCIRAEGLSKCPSHVEGVEGVDLVGGGVGHGVGGHALCARCAYLLLDHMHMGWPWHLFHMGFVRFGEMYICTK